MFVIFMRQSVFDYGTYRSEVLSTYDDFYSVQAMLGFRVPNSFFISSRCVQNCLYYNGYSTKHFDVGSYNQNMVLDEIKESLLNNKPIILLEDDVVAGLSYEIDQDDLIPNGNGFSMYKVDNEAVSRDALLVESNDRMRYHYVTITGMFIDLNEEKVTENNGVYLRVQSWGKNTI